MVDIINDALEPFGAGDTRKRIVTTGENIRFPPKDSLALSIVFNELSTNAVKYGALSNGTGTILIEWKIEPGPQGDQLILHWQEKGGPVVAPPNHVGFGSRVIAHGLDALGATVKLDYRPAGFFYAMSFPLPGGSGNG